MNSEDDPQTRSWKLFLCCNSVQCCVMLHNPCAMMEIELYWECILHYRMPRSCSDGRTSNQILMWIHKRLAGAYRVVYLSGNSEVFTHKSNLKLPPWAPTGTVKAAYTRPNLSPEKVKVEKYAKQGTHRSLASVNGRQEKYKQWIKWKLNWNLTRYIIKQATRETVIVRVL